MAYRNFTFQKIEKDFGVLPAYQTLFDNIELVQPSIRLVQDIEDTSDMALTTEKMLSEAFIFPILQDIRVRNRTTIRLFSGNHLDVDKKLGLNGECDFILTKSPQIVLKSPIICLAEAKKGEVSDLNSLAQATAQMIGARIMNRRDNAHETIYGVCTSGYEWLFLKLENDTILIDKERYTIQNLPLLLGVLQHIVDLY